MPIGIISYVALVFPPILRLRSFRLREPPVQPPAFWVKHYERVMIAACILSVVLAGVLGGLVGLWLAQSAG